MNFFIYFQYDKSKKIYLKDQYQLFTHIVETSTVSLNNIADTVFYLRINKPEILKIIFEAEKNKKNWKKLRNKLIKILMPDYKFLKKYGIRQLHFHLKEAVSFIRFHRLDKYGDSLKKIRPSLVLANKYKKIIRGFEEGRVFNGYRNVYPLFFNGEFIGTVEISFSAKAIIDMIYKTYPAFYGLLLKKSNIKNKVWSYLNQGNKYREESLFNNNLVWDKKVLDYMIKLEYLDFKKLRHLEKLFSKEINLSEKKVYELKVGNENFILMFLPVKNISHKTVAYFISLKKDIYLNNLRIHYLTLSLIITVLLIIAFVFIWLYLEKRSKYFNLLQETSYKDSLTKLLNRRGLLKSISQINGPFSLLFLDIDKFKSINDTFGHKTGDEVLKALADILRKNIRKGDLVARWGGEEFLVVLPMCDKDNAIKIAQNLRKKIEEYENENIPKFTSSFGVVSDVNISNFEEKLNKADEYLYKAKKEGRNRVIWQ